MNQWVLIIILIVVLILLAQPFLDEIARELNESIYKFRAGIKTLARRQDVDYSSYWLIVLALGAVEIIISVLAHDVFSTKQKFALIAVLLSWIWAAYWAFWRTLND